MQPSLVNPPLCSTSVSVHSHRLLILRHYEKIKKQFLHWAQQEFETSQAPVLLALNWCFHHRWLLPRTGSKLRSCSDSWADWMKKFYRLCPKLKAKYSQFKSLAFVRHRNLPCFQWLKHATSSFSWHFPKCSDSAAPHSLSSTPVASDLCCWCDNKTQFNCWVIRCDMSDLTLRSITVFLPGSFLEEGDAVSP